MKSELDYYRKFSLIDYSVNTKKFKEYVIIKFLYKTS